MPLINFRTFSKGIQTATGLVPPFQFTSAGDMRNFVITQDGQLERRAGRAHKNASALDEPVIRVIPTHYLGEDLFDGTSSAARTHLIIQTTTSLRYWNGSTFVTLTHSPITLTSGAIFDWLIVGGRLFLANGNETLWIDITPAVPVVRWWGINPNADSGYTPTSLLSLTTGLLATGVYLQDQYLGYVYTLYNDVHGVESNPSPLAIVGQTTATLKAVLLALTFGNDPQVTHARVYRTDPVLSTDFATAALAIQNLLTQSLKHVVTLTVSADLTGTVSVTHATDLTDTARNFGTLGVILGQRIQNTTTSDLGRCSGIKTTTNPNDTIHVTWDTTGSWTSSDAYLVDMDTWIDPDRIEGMHTGGNNSTSSIVDSTQNFLARGAGVIGSFISNVDDAGATGIVSGIETTTNPNDTLRFAGGLSGGTEDDFDTNERYRLVDWVGGAVAPSLNENPPLSLRRIVHHAGRIWGTLDKTASLVFSAISGSGQAQYDAFPRTDVAIPHQATIQHGQGDPIEGIHASPGRASLAVFQKEGVTFPRGTGLITGLYQVTGIANIDLDLSTVNLSMGTGAPETVVTVGGRSIFFLGFDRQVWEILGTEMRPVSIQIQDILDDMAEGFNSAATAWAQDNRYYLAIPSAAAPNNDTVCVYDLTLKRWRIFDNWEIADAIYSVGGTDDGTTYAAMDDANNLDQLFTTTQDAGVDFTAVFMTNWIQLPQESVVNGIYVYSLTDDISVDVRLDVDDVNGVTRSFRPAKSNRRRLGIFARGSRFRARISGTALDKVERVALEYETIGKF